MEKVLFCDPNKSLDGFRLWFRTNMPNLKIDNYNYFPGTVDVYDLIVSSEVPPFDIYKYPPLILINEKMSVSNYLLYNSCDLIRCSPGELEINQINLLLKSPIMSGELSVFTLNQILNTIKLIPEKKKIRIFTHNGRGCIYLDGEDFFYVEYQDYQSVTGINALSMLMELKDGYFDVRKASCTPAFSNLNASIDVILASIKSENSDWKTTDGYELSKTQSNFPIDQINIKRIREKIDNVKSIAVFSENGSISSITHREDEVIFSDITKKVYRDLCIISSMVNLGEINTFAISSGNNFWAFTLKGHEKICMKGEIKNDLLSNCKWIAEA